MRRTARWCAVLAAAAVAVTPSATALAGTSATHKSTSAGTTNTQTTAARTATQATTDLRNVGGNYNGGKALPLTGSLAKARRQAANAAAADVPVGTVAAWPALDDFNDEVYLKNFVLKSVGAHIEIWVASDEDGNEQIQFPAGDCRNTMGGGEAVTITQGQVDSFVSEFDNNMFPKESEAFSVAPDRDGTNGDYGVDGAGDRTVTLIDNVQDANYFEPSTPNGQTFIGGFFYSFFNDLTDRNVMTIDAYDWIHRTGVNPPDDSADADYQACVAALGSTRPFGLSHPRDYEGTFAHEYQHLLESYVDADEASWVNEGLSDWAQSLVGYVNTNLLGTDPQADGHIACFQGYLAQNFGGAENSLTQWIDQGDPEVLCDYGAAYSFMEYLHGRFGGDAFMSRLHREPLNGLEGLQKVIDESGHHVAVENVIHQWLAMMALDNRLDSGSTLQGGSKKLLTSPTLKSTINFDTPQAYDTPGAPPNGADYVQLHKANGGAFRSKDLNRVSFRGLGAYTPGAVEWTVQDGRLFSGAADGLDRGITREITVPADPSDATLSADLEWGTEAGWDYGFVQVYDPATGTWTSLADNEGNTTTDHADGADPAIVSNVPGFTGPGDDAQASSGVQAESFDLSPWAGQTIEVAFRYMTDTGVTGLGFWVDNVAVGGASVSDGTDLGAWQSLEQAHPSAVDGWTVKLIGFSANGKHTSITRLPVHRASNGDFVANVNRSIRAKVGRDSSFVAAIVTADDPTESAPSYPLYSLKVNGVLQPGGS